MQASPSCSSCEPRRVRPLHRALRFAAAVCRAESRPFDSRSCAVGRSHRCARVTLLIPASTAPAARQLLPDCERGAMVLTGMCEQSGVSGAPAAGASWGEAIGPLPAADCRHPQTPSAPLAASPRSRATFSKRCRKPWDAINMCMRQQLDHETCTEVFKSWRPCEDEMRRKRIKAARAAEDEQRRQLTERSKRG